MHTPYEAYFRDRKRFVRFVIFFLIGMLCSFISSEITKMANKKYETAEQTHEKPN